MQIKQHLLDKRVVKRALQEGLLDKASYQKTLDELPDLSHRIQAADAVIDDLDDDDEDELDDEPEDDDPQDEPEEDEDESATPDAPNDTTNY